MKNEKQLTNYVHVCMYVRLYNKLCVCMYMYKEDPCFTLEVIC